MKRLLYTIESAHGFLKDIETYTNDVLEAVTFTTFEFACERLAVVNNLLSTECWISAVYIPFPRPRAVPLLSETLQ